jgi:hypothetical protein
MKTQRKTDFLIKETTKLKNTTDRRKLVFRRWNIACMLRRLDYAIYSNENDVFTPNIKVDLSENGLSMKKVENDK